MGKKSFSVSVELPLGPDLRGWGRRCAHRRRVEVGKNGLFRDEWIVHDTPRSTADRSVGGRTGQALCQGLGPWAHGGVSLRDVHTVSRERGQQGQVMTSANEDTQLVSAQAAVARVPRELGQLGRPF